MRRWGHRVSFGCHPANRPPCTPSTGRHRHSRNPIRKLLDLHRHRDARLTKRGSAEMSSFAAVKLDTFPAGTMWICPAPLHPAPGFFFDRSAGLPCLVSDRLLQMNVLLTLRLGVKKCEYGSTANFWHSGPFTCSHVARADPCCSWIPSPLRRCLARLSGLQRTESPWSQVGAPPCRANDAGVINEHLPCRRWLIRVNLQFWLRP